MSAPVPTRRAFLAGLAGVSLAVAAPAARDPRAQAGLATLRQWNGIRGRLDPEVAQVILGTAIMACGQVASWGTRAESVEADRLYARIRTVCTQALGRPPMLSDLDGIPCPEVAS